MQYFSERENGPLPRDNEDIGDDVWGGIRAVIQARVEDGSFGATFPKNCDDGPVVIGTDEAALRDAMRAHVPGLSTWPWGNTAETPSTLDILDIIEFCWKNVAKPSKVVPHPRGFYQHKHLLEFDVEAGREEFSAEIETVFRRNRLAYELSAQGQIERLAYPVLREALANQDFDTGDSDLDDLLNRSRSGFLSARPGERMDALLKLWDAWERLKTIDGPGNKQDLIKAMLDATAGTDSPRLAGALDKDADGLTWVGNNLRIRHSETDKERIAKSEHVDYLFHRMFSLIQMILRLRRELATTSPYPPSFLLPLE